MIASLEAVRPIVFGTESLLGIEAGIKSQTRRLGLPRPAKGYEWRMTTTDSGVAILSGPTSNHWVKCPHGKPGDILWIKEAWAPVARPPVRSGTFHPKCIANPEGSDYKHELPEIKGVTWKAAWANSDGTIGNPSGYKWHSPRFMPKWAARTFIQIEEVRVQRLQDISEKDAMQEGVSCVPFRPDDGFPICEGFMVGKNDGKTKLRVSARDAFAALWDSINGKRNPPRVFVNENDVTKIVGWKDRQETMELPWCCWAANDPVWVLTFSVVWSYGQK